MGLSMLKHDLLQGSCLEVHAYSTCKRSLCVDGMQFSDRATWACGLKDFLVGSYFTNYGQRPRENSRLRAGAGKAGQCLSPGG